MLKLYDENHNAIGQIWRYDNLKIESELDTGDQTLSFTLLDNPDTVREEYYIRTKDAEYVVKQRKVSTDGSAECTAVLNLEELEGIPWQKFSVKDSTIEEAARLALAGTGWTVGECSVTKKRNAGILNTTVLGIIDKLCTAFMCERVYDTINKTVSFYPQIGSDKGVYLIRSLNLRKLSRESDSYDYYTSIFPVGKNGLTIEEVNDGSPYLENYQYSQKRKTYLWIDESYDDAQALMEDAELKLEDLSKPVKAYSAEVWDLAKEQAAYSILSYGLGDTLTLIDHELKIREKQRIRKLTEYPQNPEKNTCELGNTVLTFSEMQQKVKAAADVINTVVDEEGQYTGEITLDQILGFEQGVAGSQAVKDLTEDYLRIDGELTATKATLGTVVANYLSAEEAQLKYATIENLNAANAHISTLEGDYATFKTAVTDELVANRGQIDNLSGQFSSFQTQMAQELVAAKGWMLEGSIGSAQISDLDVNKLNAGTIDTAVINLASADSALQITGSQILVNDASDPLSLYNRVVLGKYTDGAGAEQYGLLVRSADGQTVMIDGDGVHNAGITDGAIDNNKVADNANISGKKLDIQSVVTEINEGETKISQTMIQVGDKSLDIVLGEQTQIIEETGERLETIESSKMYRIETAVTGRQVFDNRDQSAVIVCRVYSWDDEITGSLDESLFSWHRDSGDPEADAEWDSYHAGMKQVTITTEDIMHNASFRCDVNL